MSSVLKQLTVYADVASSRHLQIIQEVAGRVCPANIRVVDRASPLFSEHGVSAQDPLSFLKLWEAERADTVRVVQNATPFLRQFECFITSSGKGLLSGEVAYAMYQRQMPVVSLKTAERQDGEAASGSAGEGKAEAEAEGSVATALQRFLYRSSAYTSDDDVRAALEELFSFGDEAAVEGEALYAVEYDLGAADDTAMRRARAVAAALPQQLLDAAAAAAAASCGGRRELVVLRSDGYPLLLRAPPGGGGAWGPLEELPTPPPVAFAHLAAALERPQKGSANANDNGSGVAIADEGEKGAEEGEGFRDLLRHSPQLHGALAALSRYENRGLLRFLLQRGHPLAVLRHNSSAAAALAKIAADCHAADAEAVAAFDRHTASLAKFERHWLDLPTPSRTFLLRGGDNDTSTSTSTSTAAQQRWERVLRSSQRFGEWEAVAEGS